MYISSFALVITFMAVQVLEAQRCEKAQVCITDLTQEECGVGFTLTQNSHIFGCCPGCTPIGDVGEGGGDDDDNFNHKCRPPANCLADGWYAPVQCKGDVFTGRCFCTDKHGNRIFGQMWRREANEMSCACSRSRHELEEEGHVVTLHCTSNGDYEPLQCSDGMCWCVEPKTGQPTVIPVAENDVKMLPCYSVSTAGEQYLRRCESIVFALATIHKEQSEHGTNFYGNPTTFCDYDGSYGPYQIQNGIRAFYSLHLPVCAKTYFCKLCSGAYCTGRDGKILGSWQVVVSEMAGINCNCARDTSIHFPERGMTVSEVCEPNGNYRANQVANNITYCVDSDGYPLEREDWPQVCLNDLETRYY